MVYGGGGNVFNMIWALVCMNRYLFAGIVIGILLAVVYVLVFNDVNSGDVVNKTSVKASCCHPTGCVWESEAPDCSLSLCTMSCKPVTMDCGQGHCEVVGGECEVVWNE